MQGAGSKSPETVTKADDDVGAAILQFAAGRPPWMQDALRRLAMEGRLDDVGRQEVLVALKAQHGLAPTPPMTPMSRDHVRAFTGPEVKLLAIAEPAGVNRLAAGQVLTFGERGITLVYGDNGSGKTSFFRILIGVCGGRAGKARRGQERAQQVLGDVYLASPSPEPPQATLRVSSAGQAFDLRWRPNEPGLEVLRGVHIFDQFAVPKYVDEDCSLEFVPFGLQVFDELVELCRGLEELVQHEIDGLRRANDQLRPAVEPNTPSARSLASLDHETTDEQLERLAHWTKDDEASLAHLDAALGDARHLVRLTNARQRIDAVHRQILALEKTTSDEAVRRLTSLRLALADAELMARRIAEEGVTDAPLGGVGSEPWRVMLRAARRFSVELAYPGEPFPNTGQGSRCVLCQQDLDEAAQQRLRRFEAIAGDEAQRAVNDAGRLLDEALAQLPASVPSLRADLEAGLAASSSWMSWPGEAVLLDEVERFQQAAESRAAGLRAGARPDRLPSPAPCPAVNLAALIAAVAQAQTAADAALQGRAAAEARRHELRARRSLAASVDDLRVMVKNLGAISRLEACRRDVNTRAITAEGTRLKQRFVGTAFQAALEAELRALNLTEFAVRIAAKGERGVMLTRLRLADAPTPVLPGDVLSRGEQQVLALACFLAELRATGTTGAAVFDDPVSSLDQDRRRVVARRLAQLAVERQVIVLTHDIAFVYLAHEDALLDKTPCELRSLETRRSLGAGIVSEGLPFRIRKVESRINALKSEDLPRLRKAYQSGDAGYAALATGTWARLRGMWEGAIEEQLFNGVVRRFQHDVKTSSLIKVPVPQELKDMVRDAMTRLSAREVHDVAPELTGPSPSPSDFEAEIAALKEFLRRVALAAANGASAASDDAGAAQRHAVAGATAPLTPALSSAPSPQVPARPPQAPAGVAPATSAVTPEGASPKGAPSSAPGAPSAVSGNSPRPLRLVGVGRDGRGRIVRREWDEVAVLAVVTASRALDQARRDLAPISLEQFLQRRNPSGSLPCACIVEGRKVSYFYDRDDVETHLERRSRREPNGDVETRVLAPGDPEGLERALAALLEVGLDLSDLGSPGEQRPASDGDLFAGASARWALELNGREVPVFVLGDLRQLVERLEVSARVGS